MSACCAVIVTFHPPPDAARAVAALRDQVDRVLIVDNASSPEELRELEAIAGVEWIRNADNVGLAAALNQGCRRAAERGFGDALLLDQDTEPLPNLASSLLAARAAYPDPDEVGVVGANFFDDRGKAAHRTDAAEVVPFAITSGSLLSLRIYREVGPFRDDYFIDWIDYEYCWRLACHGYVTLRGPEPAMRHMWGSPRRLRVLGVSVAVFDHSPTRRYYIVRNGVYTATRYAFRFPLRCLGALARMPIHVATVLALEPDRLAKARAMARGLWHGLIGRLGPMSPPRD